MRQLHRAELRSPEGSLSGKGQETWPRLLRAVWTDRELTAVHTHATVSA